MAKSIKSVNLLPEYFRTDKNAKFLSSTIDQFIQPADIERVDGYIGTKLTPNYKSDDNYLEENLALRRNYQLEPAMVIADETQEITDVIGIDDLINEINTKGGDNTYLNKLFTEQVYSYDPHIDFDKLVNYQQYYWLTNGPSTVLIVGQQKNSEVTYSVRDDEQKVTRIINTNSLIEDDVIVLYRGNKYYFDVESNYKFTIKTFPDTDVSNNYDSNVINNGTSSGIVEIKVTPGTPNILYWVSESEDVFFGKFVIKDILEDTGLNVDLEIINKKYYVSGNGVKLTNGMKVKFGGEVFPEFYRNKDFFVEGVGNSIQLLEYTLFDSGQNLSGIYDENFDVNEFDDYPFDNFRTLAVNPEYLTINRGSKDLNPWSRYNRWVHKDVIEISDTLNGRVPVFPEDKRARRPIVEFKANLKLFNFGEVGIKAVDLIDNETLDAFSKINGAFFYFVDGTILQQGYRVIFNADTDSEVRGRIYEVNYININSDPRIELIPTDDHMPTSFSSTIIKFGEQNKGTNWWYNGDKWVFAQQHTKLNEAPLFDLFDENGISISDTSFYRTNFTGNKIFSYDIGTGKNDSVLGFPLKYRNSIGIGSYLFKNYFGKDEIAVTIDSQTNVIFTKNCFLKILDPNQTRYLNVWTLAPKYNLPILQFLTLSENTNKIEITSVYDILNSNIKVELFVNLKKLPSSKFTIEVQNKKTFVILYDTLQAGNTVLIKTYTNSKPINDGYYELPLSLTNNPGNEIFDSLTLSELSEHVQSMTEKVSEFVGTFPGTTNLRDLWGYERYGTKLISNETPASFAQLFLGKKEHNLIDALTTVGFDYYQFKLNFLRKLNEIGDILDPIGTVDIILKDINQNKNQLSPYFLSDMIPYGTDKTVRTWVVTDIRNTVYPLANTFNDTVLNLRSVLVYINDVQLIKDIDYKFINLGTEVEFLMDLTVGDNIKVLDYFSTEGSFVPPTPSKLGLFPKYVPQIYYDDTVTAQPKKVIQGHDGSITVAFNDFRDDVIIEFEKRVFNNIKSTYNPLYFDIDNVIPGYFRKTNFEKNIIDNILYKDFIRWSGTFSIEFTRNTYFDESEPKTWNYTGSYSTILNEHWKGSWRNIYKWLYDTDRPHTHPWEMLGFAIKPMWWDDTYGELPYTSGNLILWDDLERGYVRDPISPNINSKYIRSGLSQFIPVDEQGNLKNPNSFLASNITDFNKRQSWQFGDIGPAEASWRRSSLYPFAIQKVLALLKPIEYCSIQYDPSRLKVNPALQIVYGNFQDFISVKDVVVNGDSNQLTDGYSVFVNENGSIRDTNYIVKLKSDKLYSSFKLFYKAGGFVAKNKLQIKIDSIDPTSSGPGVLLPNENYQLVLNVSNPVRSINISGIVIQKSNGKYTIRGYDKSTPEFKIYPPIRNANTPAITIGGISENYVSWSTNASIGSAQLTNADTTTAQAVTDGKFFQQGQIVSYNNAYYRVKVSHRSTDTFDQQYFVRLPSLPINGGITVQIADEFSKEVKIIPYGAEFIKEQDIFDIMIGYQKWLEEQGFVFDEFNQDLGTILDWQLSGKEFLYWTLQNWANNSVITLSPFANKIKYKLPFAVVDNIFDSFYEYSLLQANGTSLSQSNVDVIRDNGSCIITTQNNRNGIYFATLNSVQKEHGLVFDNFTQFNDTIFNPTTGYKQRRMKISGFRTANWNGDYLSPGFVYDIATIVDWKEFSSYKYGDVVRYKNNYYSAKQNVVGKSTFNFEEWVVLGEKPVSGLLPNFDYKISQFEDFYSLDIDNFDLAQQELAQHLVGYTPRVYLNNVFSDPISQYKFYQGFIKEKGTKNAITKLAKASLQNFQGELTYTEEWAFRIGQFGSYSTYEEIEFPLIEGSFIENPQIVQFVETKPVLPNDLVYYSVSSDMVIRPDKYVPDNTFEEIISTYQENNFELNNAGYVHLEDITATAYNDNSLLDIANNRNLQTGDTVWLGFKQDGDWDVYRYLKEEAKIVGVFVSSPLETITFTTDRVHKLSKGQIISISQFNDQVDGIYVVKSIPKSKQFVVSSTLAAITDVPLVIPGLLFSFRSARYRTYDEMPSDNDILKLPLGTKFWVDNRGDGKWAVYERTNNFVSFATTSSMAVSDQRLGYNLYRPKSSNNFLVGSPGIDQYDKTGRVSFYQKNNNQNSLIFRYTLNQIAEYVDPEYPNEFGYSVFYDDTVMYSYEYGLMYGGAPGASFVKSAGTIGGLRYSTGIAAPSLLEQEGVVKISTKARILDEEEVLYVLLSPNPASFERFGSSIWVQRNSHTKLLLVGAPKTELTGVGAVYSYCITTSNTTSTFNISYLGQVQTGIDPTSNGVQFGYSISGNDAGSILAIGAPGYPAYQAQTGAVYVYSGSVTTGTNLLQVINSPFSVSGRFGEKVKVSSNGEYIAIGAIGVKNDNGTFGKVALYKKNQSGTYVIDQILSNPEIREGMKYGFDIDFNTAADTLIVSALGTNKSQLTTFDVNSPVYDETMYDSGMTKFYGSVNLSGTVYLYSRKNIRFVLTQEIPTPILVEGNYFGKSISLDDDAIFVGAPAIGYVNLYSAFYQFNKQDVESTGWVELRKQDDLIDLNNIKRACLIDVSDENIIEYLDIVDPIKGKIAGLAEQEITYKSSFDPAIYSIGLAGTVNDTESSWMDEHVGELWWDLSTVKYIWYEQGTSTYRKNNWGAIFPGCTIDVYEWVGSEYLPTEWSALADTTNGLTRGISGQPKFADNSVISVKQIYNPTSNSFSNYYFYWVKNKITVPAKNNRRISAYQVASIIADPVSYGIKTLAIINKDALILGNITNLLVSNIIHINISKDVINNSIPKHTEWLLMQEGEETSVPNSLLEKKLFDSLLGKDSLGNKVPTPSLSFRQKYGIGIRPQQTLFKDRLEALRNLFEFTNETLKKNIITGQYSFKNLLAQEEIPNVIDREYDLIVNDIESLSPEVIPTTQIKQAVLTVDVYNGKLISVTVQEKGSGYINPPKIQIESNVGTGGELKAYIDEFGSITNVEIKNKGTGYSAAPTISVRPFTVIVINDETSGNKWAKYILDDSKQWVRLATQKYNTSLYWDYIDWQASNYNQYKDYSYTLNDVYELESIELNTGDYVKIKNDGLGTYIILEKLDSSVDGSFTKGYDIVYKENGTIQFSDSLWNIGKSDLNFDSLSFFDETLYDQYPDKELFYILTAIKEDLFINNLKVYWNLFFFKAVKFAMSEQKLLDWAFKTSFINVKNKVGKLDQRPVYKLTDSTYYEDYLREVKPYRSQVRSFTTEFDNIEETRTYTTDFDLPAIYNKDTGKFISVDETSSVLDTYPWKSWTDNFTFEIGSILIGFPGSGYKVPPEVEITSAPGDSGSGAIAKAFVRSGQVVAVEIINPGTNYKTAPMIRFVGGGDANLTPAVGYAKLENKKVRNNYVSLRFDRITRDSNVTDNEVTDLFLCNGSINEFLLTWYATADKNLIIVKLDNVPLLRADYTIINYTEFSSGYNKKFSKLKLLNIIPTIGQIVSIEYQKSYDLLDAVGRIKKFYQPKEGMPGTDIAQLIPGIEYPHTRITALPFNYSTKWDIEYNPFGTISYADDVGYYTKAIVQTTSTVGSSTIKINTSTGIARGQFVNIISTLTNKFSTTTDIIITNWNTATQIITVNSTLSSTVYPGEVIEFWTFDSNYSILDSSIDGGTWSTSTSNTLINALGINPEDIIIDGDGFYTPSTGYAPDELIEGYVADTLGINVYTKNQLGGPYIFANTIDVYAGVGITHKMTVVPPSVAHITVTFGSVLFEYTPDADFVNERQFSINWESNELIIPEQTTNGKIGYTIIQIGGGDGTTAGVLDYGVTTTEESSAQIRSLAGFNSVKSAYVTVNGLPILKVSTSTEYGYMLTYSSEDNRRAAVNIYNLPAGNNTIIAWFFASGYSTFNEIRSQEFTVTSPSNNQWVLSYPPGNVEPFSAQVIVEYEDNINYARKRLIPPYVSYYEITSNTNKTFAINDRKTRPNGVYSIAARNVRVYLNGVALRVGFDYSITANNTITIAQDIGQIGDVIAVLDLYAPSTEFEFSVENNILTVHIGLTTNFKVKITTFTDHDQMMVRQERFDGAYRIKLGRPVLNDNYCWISINGKPLTPKLDFEILEDNVTIQFSDRWEVEATDEIVVTSIASQNLAGTVLGYRLFTDIFGRTHFKRLSKEHTTHLTQPLSFTHTEIHVADASVLTPPSPNSKVPGVVLIDGERIEFYKVENNKILKQLRRATLGTSPSFYADLNSKVIDQGSLNTIPYNETTYVQKILTVLDQEVYTINTVTNKSTYGDGIVFSIPYGRVIGKSLNGKGTEFALTALRMAVNAIPVDLGYDLNGDGLVKAGDALGWLKLGQGRPLGYPINPNAYIDRLYDIKKVYNAPIPGKDQIDVYYGGRLLRKEAVVQQDISLAYDSPDIILSGSTSTANLLPITTIENTAYIVTSTNQIWVYTKSTNVAAVNGYEYTGLNYLPAEYTVNTTTNQITLNIDEGVQNRIELMIVKKEITTSSVWNNIVDEFSTLSLLESTTKQAKFLQLAPAELPDIYYYGGDPELLGTSGFALTDENDEPLEGF